MSRAASMAVVTSFDPTPRRCAFGSTAIDPTWEQFASRETTKPWDKYYSASAEKLKAPGATFLLILYVLVIVPAVLLGVGSVVYLIHHTWGEWVFNAMALFVAYACITWHRDDEPCAHCGRKKDDKSESN
jgi:hypothetical protein